MGHEFDRDIEVTGTSAAGFTTDLQPGWKVGGGLNGGYLLAVLGNALRATVPQHPDPISISAYYLSASMAGRASVATRVLREGGLATLSGELRQEGATRITALATYGDLAALPDDVRTTAQPPNLPPLEDCLPSTLAPEELRRVAPLMERFDLRIDPAYAGWTMGKPSGEGVIQGWIRLADGREPDPMSLLLMVDALPPVTFDLGLPGWAPTVELTAHLRAVPAPGWLRVRHATRNLAGGFFEEDCEVWDAADRLVAQSRQLARTPRS